MSSRHMSMGYIKYTNIVKMLSLLNISPFIPTRPTETKYYISQHFTLISRTAVPSVSIAFPLSYSKVIFTHRQFDK